MKKPEKKIFTADDLEGLLRNRFCPPAYAFLPQVRSGTGYLQVTRTIDAIAMSLWPSRGLHLNGFEIKAGRSDWINELNNPQKAEEIAQFCDFFWVVAPKEVVKIEEMPVNWGLMVPHGATTKIVKEAKQLKATPMDRLFLAAILRRAQETITPDAELRKVRQEAFKEGEDSEKSSFKYEKGRHKELQEAVDEFEKKSGVKINLWRFDSIGEAVRMVLAGEHLKVKEELQALLERSKSITKRIEEELQK